MNDWELLTRDWQSSAEVVDVEALVRRAQLGRRRMQASFALELLAGAAVVAFWAPQLPAAGAGTALLGVGSIVFVFVWWIALWRNLRGTWSARSAQVEAFLALERRRLEAKLRWTGVLRASLIALTVLFVVASPFVLRDGWAIYREEPWRFVLGAGGVFAIVGALWVGSTRQRVRLQRALAEDQDG